MTSGILLHVYHIIFKQYITDIHSESCHASKMGFLEKQSTVQPLTIFGNSFILNFWHGSEYALSHCLKIAWNTPSVVKFWKLKLFYIALYTSKHCLELLSFTLYLFFCTELFKEAVVCRCSSKQMFLKTSQIS